jgi:NADH dehydrogenase
MRVAVFGAGYAGLTVARRLERTVPDDVDLVVVDDSGTHLVQHELHRLIRTPSLRSAITLPLDDVLSRATVRTGRVTDVDTEAGVATLTTEDGTETLSYDYGAVCLGSRTAFYDLPGLEDHAIPLKTPDHAKAIREAVTETPGGHAVVGGGGLSGVQVAGELAALSADDSLDLEVTLVEQQDRIAPGLDGTFGEQIRSELDARGVTVETGVEVTSTTDETVEFVDRSPIHWDTLVWTGGIRGPDALDGRRAQTGADLRVSPSTFVVGDAARVTDDEERGVPASAQTATREGKIAARNIRHLVRMAEDGESDDEFDDELSTYQYDSMGWVVSVGDGAVAQLGPVVVNGEPARKLKAGIGAGHLGSIGAIGNATDLVASELGWPTSDAVDLATLLTSPWEDAVPVPTDPSTPGDLQAPFVGSTLDFLDTFAPDEAVDLTWMSGLLDAESTKTDAVEALFSTPFDVLSAVSETTDNSKESE